jgi:hypothetical protein
MNEPELKYDGVDATLTPEERARLHRTMRAMLDDFNRRKGDAVATANMCTTLIFETARMVGMSPAEFQFAFDEWHKDKTSSRIAALLVCKNRAKLGAPMPWQRPEPSND